MVYRTERDRNQSMSIRGGVTPYRLEYKPTSEVFGKVVSTLNEQQEKTAEQLAKIKTAINQLPLDHSEDAYKENLIKSVSSKIDANPFDVPGAIRLGYDTANDKELLTKVRTTEEHTEWQKDLHTARLNGKINAVTEQRLLANKNNQYKYSPYYDDNGNVIGANKWQAGEDWVPSVDRTALAKYAGSLAQAKTTGTRSGGTRSVTNADGTGKSSGGYTQSEKTVLTSEEIDEVFKGVFQTYPGAEASLMQDYKDDVWELEQLKQKEVTNGVLDVADADRKKQLEERLNLPQGGRRTPREYMAYSMDLIIPHMRIDNSSTASESNSNIDNNGNANATASGNFTPYNLVVGDTSLGELLEQPFRAGTMYGNSGWRTGRIGTVTRGLGLEVY